jgi:bacterioferritin-associated ferredoxin
MYVCICKAVTESQIEDAIDEGAKNLRDLQLQLGVATQCGQCACTARQQLTNRRAKKPNHKHNTPLRWIPTSQAT